MKKIKLLLSMLIVTCIFCTVGVFTVLADEEAPLPTFTPKFIYNDTAVQITRNSANNGSVDISLVTDTENFKKAVAVYDESFVLDESHPIEIDFSFKSFNQNGELWVVFTDSEEALPYDNSGHGFGVRIYDESNVTNDVNKQTYKPYESLRFDSYVFTGTGPNLTGLHRPDTLFDVENGAKGYLEESFTIKAHHVEGWGWAVQLFKADGTYVTGGADYASIPNDFKFNRTQVMFASQNNLMYESSYEKNNVINVTSIGGEEALFTVENTKTEYSGGTFSSANDQTSRVIATLDNNQNSKLELVTDANYSNTRAVYSNKIDISKVFEMDLTFDQFNEDGYMQVAFLSGKGDYAMEGYGDGFSVMFWDETAWGYTKLTSLRSDYYIYGKDGTKNNVKQDRLTLDSIIGSKVHIKVWNFDAENLAMEITCGAGKQVIGTISKALLPANFDYTDCFLLILPGIDGSRAHSYEKNIKVTVDKDPNGQLVEAPYNMSATAGENGTATVKEKAYIGELVEFDITANEGFVVDTATLNGDNVEIKNGKLQAVVDGDMTLNVTFKVAFTVSATTNEGGSVTPESAMVGGGSVTFTVTPDAGYKVKSAKLDGESVELANNDGVLSYTVDNVEKNISFEVVFVAEYTIRYYDGTRILATKTAEAGSSFPAFEAPTKEGYTFTGWFTDRELKTKFDEKSLASADVTVFAGYVEASEDNKSSEEKAGCSSSIQADFVVIMAVAVLGTVIVLKKKRV